MLGFFFGVTPDFSTASGNLSGAAVASTICKCCSYRHLVCEKYSIWDLWVFLCVLGIVICHTYCSVRTKNVFIFFVASCKSFNHFLIMDTLAVHHHPTDNVQDVFRNRSFGFCIELLHQYSNSLCIKTTGHQHHPFNIVRNLQTESVMSNTSN